MDKVHSAYGPWLAHVMNDRRISTVKLAKKAGVSTQIIDDLIRGHLAPEKARDEVMKIGEIAIGGDNAKDRMKQVMRALDVHIDLRNWADACDGGCCPWSAATEISLDEVIRDTGRKEIPR